MIPLVKYTSNCFPHEFLESELEDLVQLGWFNGGVAISLLEFEFYRHESVTPDFSSVVCFFFFMICKLVYMSTTTDRLMSNRINN